jgi:hypothetical protein
MLITIYNTNSQSRCIPRRSPKAATQAYMNICLGADEGSTKVGA